MPEYILEHGDVQLTAFASFLTYYVPARILQIFETVESARADHKDRSRSRGILHVRDDTNASQCKRR